MKFIKTEPVGAGRSDVAGATVAGLRRRDIEAALKSVPPDEPIMLALDFEGIQFATASYLKGVWLTFVRAGALWLEGTTTPEVDGAAPRDVYPVLVNVSADVRHELVVLARSERVCAVEARPLGKAGPGRVILLGDLEPAVRSTIDALGRRGRASAVDLHAAEASKLAATAWNNRLYELCRLRVATRTKVGRQFVYELVASEVSYG